MFGDFISFLQRLENEEISIEEVYDHCFKQIQSNEINVNALTTKVEMKNLEKMKIRATKLKNTRLKGLPIIVKDSILTKDFITTNGQEKYKNYIPKTDATVVDRINKAGGIILAKSNLSEGAMDYQTFNHLFGITNHPLDNTKSPGGSSGGSAAAVALEYAPFALGSDMGGSLRVPANFCGISTLRPTLGTIPIDGHIGSKGTNFELTIGAMAQDPQAVNYLNDVLRNEIPRILEIKKRGLTIGVSSFLDRIRPTNGIENMIKQLYLDINREDKKRDQKTIELNELLNFELDLDVIIQTHNSMVQNFIGEPHSLTEIELKENQSKIRNQIDKILENLDAWILPVNPIPVPNHNLDHERVQLEDHSLNYWIAMGYYCWPFSVSGHPVATIPIGKLNGFPLGIQVVGHYQKDKELLEVVEQLYRRISEDTNFFV